MDLAPPVKKAQDISPTQKGHTLHTLTRSYSILQVTAKGAWLTGTRRAVGAKDKINVTKPGLNLTNTWVPPRHLRLQTPGEDEEQALS